MAKLSKRVKAIKAKVDRTKAYPFDDAIDAGQGMRHRQVQ